MRDFDLDRPWTLAPGVALRYETFGALAYSFETRRLSRLKSRRLLRVVESLADHPTGRAACLQAGVPEGELRHYESALSTLAAIRMIAERGGS